MSRIVRLANYITPTSGGLRTALRELGTGYAAAGHEPVLVIPGPAAADEMTPQGRIITLLGPRAPGIGGYRLLVDRRAVARTLTALKPDRVEVSDRTTLRWTGAWAHDNGVPSVMVSHESVEGLLRVVAMPAGVRRQLALRLNRASAQAYNRIVCTTSWAAREFDGTGAANVVEVPLGVDLELFHPDRYRAGLRDRYALPHELLLLSCTRLSVEKRPQRALTTLTTLLDHGVKARLVMAGDGPLRSRLEKAARDLPVEFTGWVGGREEIAALQSTADVVLAPGPIETFGLAALEALACGTPVVVSASSALPGVVAEAGVAVDGDDFADGVLALLDRPEASRRSAARAQAEKFSWQAAVNGFLAVHESLP